MLVGNLSSEAWWFAEPTPWDEPDATLRLDYTETDQAWAAPGLLADLDDDGHADVLSTPWAGVCAGGSAGPSGDCVPFELDGEVVRSADAAVLRAPEVAVLFGAPDLRGAEPNQSGRALVFDPAGTRVRELTPTAGDPTACFGAAVAVSDGWVAVSDSCFDENRGGVHLFLDI
jgi:hypothetical protein